MGNEMVFGVTPDEYEESAKSGSKFAAVGLHLSEITELPFWKTAGKSVAFPFKIIDGDDAEKIGELVAGIDPDVKDSAGKVTKKGGIWKFDECRKAIGVSTGTTSVKNPKTGKPEAKVNFDPSACLGKQFYSEWAEFKDSRTPQEGGKGSVYTKPVRFWSLEDGAKKLGKGTAVDL